jgi:photosystem II stability/assembly factor-like uncharacterized protein
LYIIINFAFGKRTGNNLAGTDDGNVQLTRDGGKTWTSFRGKISGMPLELLDTASNASRHNAAEAFVCVQ